MPDKSPWSPRGIPDHICLSESDFQILIGAAKSPQVVGELYNVGYDIEAQP